MTWVTWGKERVPSLLSSSEQLLSVYTWREDFVKLIGTGSTAAFLSLIYSLIYKYFEEKNINVSLAQQIKDYVNFNYVKGVNVKSLSEFFGYERSYIYRIFKQKFGVGIKEYILSTCMENANSLLKNGVNVKQTALSVGYKDQLAFSKAYKNYFGFSPKNTNWENIYTKN